MKPTFKWSKLPAILAVVLLSCFVFAGMALAADPVQIEVNTSGYPAGYDAPDGNNLKADHTYKFDIDITLPVAAPLSLFTDQYPPDSSSCATNATNKLIVDFVGFVEDDNLGESYSDGVNPCPPNNTILFGKSLDAQVTLTNGNTYNVRVKPELYEESGDCEGDSSVVDRVYFTLERQFIKDTASVASVKIIGLELTTPDNPGNYTVCVSHTNDCFQKVCGDLNVVETVDSIVLDPIDTTDCLTAGSSLHVSGTVLSTENDADCAKLPWKHSSWPVIIEVRQQSTTELDCGLGEITEYLPVTYNDGVQKLYDCLGYQTCFPCDGDKVIAQVIAHVGRDGKFSQEIKLPTCVGSYYIVARTIEVMDENLDSTIEFTNAFVDSLDFIADYDAVPVESLVEDANNMIETGVYQHIFRSAYTLADGQETLEHAWVKAEDLTFTVVAGEPWFINQSPLPQQLELGEAYPVTINLTDKYCNPTINSDVCGGADRLPIKIELAAYTGCDAATWNKSAWAGKFYSVDPDTVESASLAAYEIIYTEIAPAEGYAQVWFVPDVLGKITLEEAWYYSSTSIRGTGQCCIEVLAGEDCTMEVTYLVTGGDCERDIEIPDADRPWQVKPKDGWPVKVSVRYVGEPTYRVELLDEAGNLLDATKATWDYAAKTDDVAGVAAYLSFNADGDYASLDYLETADHHVGYDTGKTDFYVYFKNACGNAYYVRLVNEATNTYVVSKRIGKFAPAADLIRILEPDTWQILSTPQILAGDGDMQTLLPTDPYTEILTYKDNAWVQVLPVDQLEPLYAYLLNMKQNYCPDPCAGPNCGEEKNVYAQYVFARAVDPSYAMPATRLLSKGANLVGPSFGVDEMNPLTWAANELVFGAALGRTDSVKASRCFRYDGGCCDCDDCAIGKAGRPICANLLFQPDSLAHLTMTFCDGCTAILNYGGDSALECRNSKGNLAWFTTAALGGNNVGSWLQDPLYYAFNGDGYLTYLTQSQTMTGAAQLQLVDIDE